MAWKTPKIVDAGGHGNITCTPAQRENRSHRDDLPAPEAIGSHIAFGTAAGVAIP